MNMNMIFIQSAIDILELVIVLYIHSTVPHGLVGAREDHPLASPLFLPLHFFLSSSSLLSHSLYIDCPPLGDILIS